MTDLNEVILIGRLTKDAETGYIANGTAKANVSIAVNRSIKKGDSWEDETSFFDVVIWGKTAENLQPYLLKGKQIVIKGSLRQDRWEKDGQKHSRISINAENVYLMGGKSDSNGGYNGAIVAAAFGGEIVSGGEEFPVKIPF